MPQAVVSEVRHKVHGMQLCAAHMALSAGSTPRRRGSDASGLAAGGVELKFLLEQNTLRAESPKLVYAAYMYIHTAVITFF